VIWRESEVSWSYRWDICLNEDHFVLFQVHVYSMFNSVFVLTMMLLVAITIWIRRIRHTNPRMLILRKTLCRRFYGYDIPWAKYEVQERYCDA
jgi:hypothetical protein